MNVSKKKTVYTFMCLDLPHIGHINFIREAKKLGDVLIVGILTDDVIKSYKREPVMKYNERCAMAQSIRYIDVVVRQCHLDPTHILKTFNPDVLCHGDDWNDIPGSAWMKKNGKEVKRIEYYPHQSTTKIIQVISERLLTR